MKITDVRARSVAAFEWLRAGSQRPAPEVKRPASSLLEPVALVVVEVFTDEDLVGLGTVGGFCEAAQPIIQHHFRELLIGENPLDVERLWLKLYNNSHRYGLRGAAIEALSGVDIALWDIMGKAFGQPVYRLLGGRTKESVPVYASHLIMRSTLEQLAEEARQDVAQGFGAVKMWLPYNPSQGLEGMDRNEEMVAAIREAIGPKIDLMVDCFRDWTVAYALQMVRRLEKYRLYWLEEPLPTEDVEGYARLSASVDVPIAAGEHESTRYAFADLIRHRAVSILQPDINRVGGLTEAGKICALASAFGLQVCFHQGWLYSYHLTLAQPNCPVAEYFPKPKGEPFGNRFTWAVLHGEPEAKDGYVEVPEVPGLGWEINEEAMQRHAYRHNSI